MTFLAWLENSSGLAAWAQVLGIVVAVAATLLTVTLPLRRQNFDAKHRAKLVRLVAVDTVESASASIEHTIEIIARSKGKDTEDGARMANLLIDRSISSFDTFPRFDLSDLQVFQSMRLAEDVLHEAKLFVSSLRSDDCDADHVNSVMSVLVEHRERLKLINDDLVETTKPRVS